MPLANNKKVWPGVNLDGAKEQVRTALRRAFAECGGQAKFTRLLNERLVADGQQPITQQAVSYWLSEGQFIHERYWPHVEAISDLATTRRHLRPDVYGLAHP